MKPEQEAVLRERYADKKNRELAGELGVSERTVRRWAKELGLEKSEEFLKGVLWEASMQAEYLRLCGKRVGGVPKGVRTREGCGFVRTEEVEKKRIAAIRKTAWEERQRVLRGEKRRTGWRMVDYGKEKVDGKWQKA